MKNLSEMMFVVIKLATTEDSTFYTRKDIFNPSDRLFKCALEELEREEVLSDKERILLRTVVDFNVQTLKDSLMSEMEEKFNLWITDFAPSFPETVPAKAFVALHTEQEVKDFLKKKVDEMVIEF